MQCPLCHSEHHRPAGTTDSYFNCMDCGLVFRNPSQLPSVQNEFKRYQLHQNDMDDPGYQKFVQPTVLAITNDYPATSKGLDFGAGPGPVIAHLLEKRRYTIARYDPFFHPDRSALKTTYDYIICCEVIEHFHHPDQEFTRLKGLLRPGGTIYCQTLLWDESISIDSWHYSRDPTHVVFYTEASLAYIQKTWEFKSLTIEERLITLRL